MSKTIRFIKVLLNTIQIGFWQNDYLYPLEFEKKNWDKLAYSEQDFPFKKKHLWKTRLGFKTAYELSQIIIPEFPKQ